MNSPVVYSTLAADPDLADLVEMFVEEMPGRIQSLETQASGRNWEQLRRTAHQLKGAAGSYGFIDITPRAARLEHAAKNPDQEDEILLALDELLSLCRGVQSGVPPAGAQRYPCAQREDSK